jgi:hypothetical protein
MVKVALLLVRTESSKRSQSEKTAAKKQEKLVEVVSCVSVCMLVILSLIMVEASSP